METLSGMKGIPLIKEIGTDVLREGLSAISLVGALVVIISYVTFRQLHKLSFTLILNLAICNALSDINYLLMDSRLMPAGACKFQAIFQSWFALSSVLWTTVISYCIKMSIINRQPCADKMPFFYAYAYAVPCLLAFMPLAMPEYRNNDGWCWILTANSGDNSGLVLRLVSFYVPLWIAVLYNLISLGQIRGMVPSFILPGPASTMEHARVQKTLSRLGMYPIILAVCWIWGTANRVQQVVNPGHPVYALQVLQIVSRTLQGVLTGIVFLCNPSVRHAYREAVKKAKTGNSGCLRVLARIFGALCCIQRCCKRRRLRMPYLPWKWHHRRGEPSLLANSTLKKMELSSLFDLTRGGPAHSQSETQEEVKDPENLRQEHNREQHQHQHELPPQVDRVVDRDGDDDEEEEEEVERVVEGDDQLTIDMVAEQDEQIDETTSSPGIECIDV